MKTIRMLAVGWALLLCVTAVPVAAEGAVATVATVTAAPGQTVDVPVSVVGGSDVGGIGLTVQYDPSVLEPVDGKATGLAAEMAMAEVNIKPVNGEPQAVLSAMDLSGHSPSGDVMILTFRVKSDAPSGFSAIEFVGKPELVSASTFDYVDVTTVNGGINVSGAPVTDEPIVTDGTVVVTTPPTATPPVQPSGNVVNDGTATTPTAGTAYDVGGALVTTPAGEPAMVQGVAVTLADASGKPGETVKVDVMLSAYTDLKSLGINVKYDTVALTFVGGIFREDTGIADIGVAQIEEREDGIVCVEAAGQKTVSGEGVIATLEFHIEDTAEKGEYRLSLSPAPQLLNADSVVVPLDAHGGVITCTADGKSGIPMAVVVGLGVACVAVVVMVRRKGKKAPAAKQPTRQPHDNDISGE